MSAPRVVVALSAIAVAIAACSDGGNMSPGMGMPGAGTSPGAMGGVTSVAPPVTGNPGAAGGTVTAGAAATAGAPGTAGAGTSGAAIAGMGPVAGGEMIAGGGGSMPGAAGAAGAGTAGMAGGAAGASGAPASGPKDGDPNAPVVAVPDVPCRPESALTGAVVGSSVNAMIGGRELAIDYPCGKHEGAHMTVILNLHGTLIMGAPFLYQRAYFSAYRLIYSHNLIVVHPKSASTVSYGAQWGNQDNGTDLPHLIEVMNWVYKSFEKFQIRSTWIGGHSWGAYYAEGGGTMPGFVCNEMFKDRFKGVIGMSRLAVPPCADRVSMIGTRGSEENIALLDQNGVATAHGCDSPIKGPEMLGNNERFYFEGCDPGWVHEDYNMLGKGHIDSMDAEVVRKIVEQIKSTEL